RTNNDSQNAPMLAVNRKLGYQPQPGFYRMRAQLMPSERINLAHRGSTKNRGLTPRRPAPEGAAMGLRAAKPACAG
ncbi:MAG TPA: hypothetical protein VIC27_10950, partial [Ktedonobacterales bacterium]